MSRWVPGNRVELLENGEAFYPRAFAAIAAAKREVLVETFILFDDKVGRQLQEALLAAARNGASVDVTIDGWGSAFLPDAFTDELTAAGVRIHAFDPAPVIFSWRINVFRRLHRKLLVVDGERAFVGGINYSHDHLADYGPESKQDYAVEITGPIVRTIHGFVREALRVGQPHRGWLRRQHREAQQAGLPAAGPARMMFVTRDNRAHRNDIELHYRAAIRLARKRVVLANAYFFPGYRLLRDLRRAAGRGIDVRLILQGTPDMPIVRTAAQLLYNHLLRAGVQILEYEKRPLHGKVALVDDEWATVGSSNLEPLSLSLNLEANVMIRDRAFNHALAERLEVLMREECRPIDASELPKPTWWSLARSYVVFHFLRHFPALAGWLPRHAPKVEPLRAEIPGASQRRSDARVRGPDLNTGSKSGSAG